MRALGVAARRRRPALVLGGDDGAVAQQPAGLVGVLQARRGSTQARAVRRTTDPSARLASSIHDSSAGRSYA